jgi:SAM-dependent methyltransferase
LLEIGVFNGESLKAWREYFQNIKMVVGLDINRDCKQHEDIENNIFVEILDGTTALTAEFIKSKYGQFDIIIDDGSHTIDDVINSFNNMFYLLKDGGIYIIEDTICYKNQYHIAGSKYNTNHLSYFSNFITYLNQWRYDSESGIIDHCIDPFKIIKKTSNNFEISIDKIESGTSYIAIHKRTKYHWIP